LKAFISVLFSRTTGWPIKKLPNTSNPNISQIIHAIAMKSNRIEVYSIIFKMMDGSMTVQATEMGSVGYFL